jgi:uncharacterized LabA/DUF88 family protein
MDWPALVEAAMKLAADPRAGMAAATLAVVLAVMVLILFVRSRRLAARLVALSNPRHVLFQSVLAARGSRAGMGRPLVPISITGKSRIDAPAAIRSAEAQPRTALHVKIYVDCSNLLREWHKLDKDGTVDWDLFPRLIMEALAGWPEHKDRVITYRRCNVYGSYFNDEYYDLLEKLNAGSVKRQALPYQPNKRAKRIEELAAQTKADASADRAALDAQVAAELADEIARWRVENARERDLLVGMLNRKLGYTAFPVERRTPPSLRATTYTSDGVPIAAEKRVDTAFCTELIADAVYDLYDVAVVVSADEDFVPPIEFVVKELGRQVVQVGNRTLSNIIRDSCTGAIDLQDIVQATRQMRGAASKAAPAKAPAKAAG